LGHRVAIVGAGYAGMAAAVTLAAKGIPVTVFESGPVPGGRARRVKTEGRELDNGQHILVGAYSELLRLMHEVGVPSAALLRVPLELRYADGFSFRALWFPAPLGLLGGLLTCSGLPWSDRLGAIRFMTHLKKTSFKVGNATVSELLVQHGQDGRIGHYLWRPLCVSALNTPAESASAQAFAVVLRDSLAGGDGASDLLLPRVDLSKLFPEPAAEFLKSKGSEIRVNDPVRELGALITEYGNVIVAVGPHQLKTLLPQAPAFDYQPIYTCYLQYPEQVRLSFPMLGFADGLVQWAFDRRNLTGEKGLIACVISAQGDHQQLSQDEIATTCHRELAAVVKDLPDPAWSRVIAEKRATVSCVPREGSRSIVTEHKGVFLAGDYLDPEYPPTLEAAVRSGVRAARQVIDHNPAALS
jgi:hydroxysqualene dehydroxylase